MVNGKVVGESAHRERILSSLCYQFGHLARFFHLNALNSKGLSWGSNTNSPRRLLLSVQLSYCASDVFKEGISLCGPWNGRTRRRHNERGPVSSRLLLIFKRGGHERHECRSAYCVSRSCTTRIGNYGHFTRLIRSISWEVSNVLLDKATKFAP